MNGKLETITSDNEVQFDEMVNTFLAKVLNPVITFNSTPVLRNGDVITMFIAHITYIDFLENIQ